jgi:arabinogalactan endo-1,4-beta-galactosidase
MQKSILAIASLCFGTLTSAATPFWIGADISWLPRNEASGRTYSDGGVKKDGLILLKDNGFNCIRLRIFHNPKASGGYSPQGYCGTEETIKMAKRVKAAGMAFLLDFHYSDNWADPGKQKTPAAWANLNLAQLTDSVHNYTKDVLLKLKDVGALPDMVQIGNETNPGFMLPLGSKSNFANYAALTNAGIAATREVSPSIKVGIHIAMGGDNPGCRSFMDKAIAANIKFDVLCLSCYTQWHGPASGWESNFKDLASRYPTHSFVIAEYSQEKKRANDIMYNLPNEKGLGAFEWEPLDWEEKVVANTGAANDLMKIYPELAKSYAPRLGPVSVRADAVLHAGQEGGRLRMWLGENGSMVLRPLAGDRRAGIHDGLGRALPVLRPD